MNKSKVFTLHAQVKPKRVIAGLDRIVGSRHVQCDRKHVDENFKLYYSGKPLLASIRMTQSH